MQVSPLRGLLGSLWTLLTHVESLTSHLDREEGFWWPAISSPSPHLSTHHPPHEQLLVGLGAVGVSSTARRGVSIVGVILHRLALSFIVASSLHFTRKEYN